MRILSLISVYLPGYKSGGPVRSMASTVDQLGETFDFWILTGDRDFRDTEPYADVPCGKWISVGSAQVFYANLKSLSLGELSELIRDIEPDVIYLNSFFSLLSQKYLLARRAGMIPQIPAIVAPRGSFSPGALRLKRAKKSFYLRAAQWTGLFNGLCWHAATELEKEHILAVLPTVKDREIHIASDLAQAIVVDLGPSENGCGLIKESGSARFIYLSRISHSKNLKFALTLLRDIDGQIDFDIYGPIEDPAYWEDCLQIIAQLPDNVSVHTHGAIPHDEVDDAFSNGHFLLLPTLGESFGHVIFEALQVGCPVIISDRTPWNDVPESAAGWIIPLEECMRWIETLTCCVEMGPDDYARYSENARWSAKRRLSSSDVLEANKSMFLDVGARLER